jgi:hypothetical protein
MTTRRKLMGLIAALVVLAPLPVFLASCKAITDEEVKNAMQIEILETKWVMKEYRQWPNPKLVLVPCVVFRIKNLAAETMAYVSFNGIFKERNAVENRGDNFLAAIRKKNAVARGGWSEPITLKSNFGTEGMSVKTFQNNPQWKPVWVKIYAQWKGSRHVLLGEWPVAMTIDFKEPEQPVIQGGKKEGEVKKDETKK